MTSDSEQPRRRGLELALDRLGGQAQRELAEGGEVALREEPVEGDLGALRRVDVAVLHPLPERMRAHVHELDLVGRRAAPRPAGAR